MSSETASITTSSSAVGSSTAPVSTSSTMATLLEAANEVISEEKNIAEKQLTQATEDIIEKVTVQSKEVNKVEEEKSAYKEQDRIKPEETKSDRIAVSLEDDVEVLLSKMRISPKFDANADVDALFAEQRRKSHGDTEKESNQKKAYSYNMQRNTFSALPSNNLWMKRSDYNRKLVYTAEPSRVAHMLEVGDQSWIDSVRTSSLLSQTQEKLFRSMKVVVPEQRRPTSASSSVVSRERRQDGGKTVLSSQHCKNLVDRLSVSSNHFPSKLDLKLDPSLKHTTFSDAKNCRFYPITAAGQRRKKLAAQEQSSPDNNNKKEDAKFSFINRQETEERARREDLQFQIGKKEYDALVDKKRCPKCGAKKSYDEVKEKKKLCPNCKVEYCPAVDWAKISKSFFRKEKEYAMRAQERLEKVQKELEVERTYATYSNVDSRTGSVVQVRAPLKQQLTKEEEREFFDRMEQRMKRREQRMKQLESQVYDEICSFQPSILSSKGSRSAVDDETYDDDDDDDEGRRGRRDPVEAFMNRYYDDLNSRKEKFPDKFK